MDGNAVPVGRGFAPRGNEEAVLPLLRGAASLILTELVGLTRLSRPTVEEAVSGLVGRSLVRVIPPESEDGRKAGRPARRFAFRPEVGHVVACDMGVELARVLVTRLDGGSVGRGEVALAATLGVKERLAAVVEAVDALLGRAGLSRDEVWAVGVATTGIVDAAGTVVLSSRLPELTGVSLADLWAERFPGAVVRVGNDARCAALAEHWIGAAVDVDDSVTVLAGTALAAAITLGGEPYRGSHGASGEVGGVPELGWSRAVAALQALYSPTGPGELPRRGAEVDYSDPEASELLSAFVEALTPGLVTLVSVIDPPRVIVGGEIAAAGAALTGPLHAVIAERCLFPVDVVASALGDDSSLLGALRGALNEVDAVLGRPQPAGSPCG